MAQIRKHVPRLTLTGEAEGDRLEAVVTSLGEPFRKVVELSLSETYTTLNQVFLDMRDAKELRDWLNLVLKED